MKIEEFNQCLNTVKEILSLDIRTILSEAFAEQGNIENLSISSLTVPEFMNLTRRVLTQLENELTTGLGKLLPNIYNYSNEYGTGTLSNALTGFKTELEGKTVATLQAAEIYLLAITYYQIANGFYDKSERNIHNMRGINASEIEDKLKLLIEHLNENSKKKEILFKELGDAKTSIEDLITVKKDELKQITNNLDTANQNSQNIATLLNNSTESSTKINSLLDKINESYDKSKLKISEENKSYDGYKKNIEKLITESSTLIETFKEQIEKHSKQLEFVDSKTEYFDERNKYLDELIGREVGASLFETFKQRKMELRDNIKIWSTAVLGCSILLLVALLVLFWEIPTNAGWEFFLVRSLKSVPLAVLLYFAIRQYTRERSFQEEYAFKSACALTIKAYADIIKDEVAKDKLILDGVFNVYQSPIREKEKGQDLNKKVLDMGVNISESVKNISKK